MKWFFKNSKMSGIDSLPGKKLGIWVSDPWSFMENNDGTFFTGTIIVAESKNLLIKSDKLIKSDSGELFDTFVCGTRYVGETFDSLFHSKTVNCAFTGIPPSRIDKDHPFDVSWWRGGGCAMIGCIALPVHGKYKMSSD